MVVLGAGFGLLTAAGWLLNGALAARSTAGPASPPAGQGAAGSAPPHAHTGAAPTPAPSPSPAPARHRASKRPPASGGTRACARDSVRLTVSSPQSWYQSGTTPRFTVRAVSTAGQPCRFNMGTRFVAVVIASGNRHLWSSADCPGGAGSRPAVLAGSRPAVLRVSWDRRTSSPGCSGTTHLVRPGEYQAEAVAGHVRSRPVNIVLGAKGASGP